MEEMGSKKSYLPTGTEPLFDPLLDLLLCQICEAYCVSHIVYMCVCANRMLTATLGPTDLI